MNTLFKIKPCDPSHVRTSLCIEDVNFHNLDGILEFGLVKYVQVLEDEKVLVFNDGYQIPYFNIFYANRIKSPTDPYLSKLILRLLYLNPCTEDNQIKSITSFILNNFSAKVKTSSKVKPGETVLTPILKFNDVYCLVLSLQCVGTSSSYVPLSEKLIMYSKNSKLTKNEKISLNAFIRKSAVISFYEKAIHHTAEFLNESQEFVAISTSGIENTKLIKKNDKSVSKRTIERYMSQRTKDFIEEVNSTKPFKSNISYEKYCKFTAIPKRSTMSLEELASKLNTSKSTILEYRRVEEKIKLINI